METLFKTPSPFMDVYFEDGKGGGNLYVKVRKIGFKTNIKGYEIWEFEDGKRFNVNGLNGYIIHKRY